MRKKIRRRRPWRRRQDGGRAASGLAAAALTVAATLGPAAPTASAAGNSLTISGAWMRMIIPARPAAGYFTLHNSGEQVRHLVGAQSPACGSLMLHHTESSGGVERMVMVPSVAVPAHGGVTFAPGGYHLMCMEPSAALMVPGHSVPVTLKFGDGETVSADFAVRNAAGK